METVFKTPPVVEAGLREVTPMKPARLSARDAAVASSATPGHTRSSVVRLGQGFIQSDVTNIPRCFVTNPGWHYVSTMTRRWLKRPAQLLRHAVAENAGPGFHTVPGQLFCEQDGTGYRLVPAPWTG